MIIGSGQLAKVFDGFVNNETLIFASGVSNSSCINKDQFEREKMLLLKMIEKHSNKKFVYFSSCALSAPGYPKNAYYNHKKSMERILKDNQGQYYIFRLPQLFGDLINHKTLINYIYNSILQENAFTVYDHAYRYVIEMNDVRDIVNTYLKYHEAGIVIDLANPYSYRVLDIVHIFERLLNKKAKYQVIEKNDRYTLDLTQMLNFTSKHDLKLEFGSDYLLMKLKEKILSPNG